MATLSDDRRHMFDRFRVVDVARKVVGVGSVGTGCLIALLEGPDHPDTDLIVLQVKEAQPSVLEPYVGESELGHHGKRVVVGQRLIQAAGDIFLGWADGPRSGRHYYVRQLWDFKGQGDPMVMPPERSRATTERCARGSSPDRTPAPATRCEIAGYLGSILTIRARDRRVLRGVRAHQRTGSRRAARRHCLPDASMHALPA